MAYPTFREIMISYANTRGGGLPLSAEEICNATVLYVQEELGKNLVETRSLLDDYISAFRSEYEQAIEQARQELTPNVKNEILYGDVIEGSETIVVDINEGNTALEIHLDAEVVAKIDRSVKTPLQTPTEPKLPVLGVDNAVVWEPVSSFAGGGGTKLYMHNIFQAAPVEGGPTNNTYAISLRATPYTDMDQVRTDFIDGRCLKLMLGNAKNVVAFYYDGDAYICTPSGFQISSYGLMPLKTDTVTEL